MTVKELNRILTANNIPEDARLMSDSGWECCATDMDGVYYNPKENIIVFTQEEDYSDYCKKPEWVKVEVNDENNALNFCQICGEKISPYEQICHTCDTKYGIKCGDSITDSILRLKITSKWIPLKHFDETYAPVYKCSICGYEGYLSDYCPGCGRKMEAADDK